jgi:hypothetical protein
MTPSRATHACSARPATVTFSRTAALAMRAHPPFPAPGKPPGQPGGHTGCMPESAAHVKQIDKANQHGRRG